MLKSTEIHWFFEGRIPFDVGKISIETSPDDYENRTDYYLSIQGCDNIGIKIRNSRFEIKRRQHVRPYDSGKLNVSGYIERWQTWGWNNETTSIEIEQLFKEDDDAGNF